MARLTESQLRDGMSGTIDRVVRKRERIMLTRSGKPLAAVVPLEDIEALEAMEDAADLREARKALREFRQSGEKSIPFEEICRGNVYMNPSSCWGTF